MKKSTSAKPESASVRATYQDVLDAPPHMVAEIVAGRLYTFPRPSPANAVARSGLGGLLNPSFQYGRGGPGGWWILNEPELHLSEDIVVPDLAGWRRERMPGIPSTAYFTLVPDWVCEVLSPSTRRLDLGGKSEIYARESVRHFWLVDPDARSLEAYALRDAAWLHIDTLFEDASVSLPPFEAVTFNLGDLWPPPAVHKDLPSKVRPRESKSHSEPELAESSK